MTAAELTVEALFAPVALEEFVHASFERAPLHVRRDDPAYFRELYDVADVEDALFVGAAARERFALVKDGIALSPDAYVTAEPPPGRPWARLRGGGRTIDPRIVLGHFERGYTLVVSDATQFSPRLGRLCNRVQQRLGCFALANVYFTPAGARGFDPHYDSHGIVVLQISGSKRWRLYDVPTELPTEAQPFSAERHGTRLGAPREVELRPGDTLYLPQGVPHEGTAGERSLHVTLALAPPRAADFVARLLDVAAATDVELRRALPVGWHESPELLSALAQLAGRRLSAQTPQDVAVAAELLLGDVSAGTRPAPQGTFAALDAAEALTPDRLLRLREDAPYSVRAAGADVKLLVGDRVFGLPAACAPLLERLRAAPVPYADVRAALGADAAEFVKLLALIGLLANPT